MKKKAPYRNDLHRLMSQPESWFTGNKTPVKPRLNAKHAIRVWTRATVGSRWSLGGTPKVKLIATELEVEGPYSLGKGYSGFIAKSPKGETYVVERTTGGFVGGSLAEVKKDVKVAKSEMLAKQMADEMENAAKAILMKPETFWSYLE
jgi:hypothetical protein